jgi:hypothetical protein
MSWFDGETVKTAGGDSGNPGLRADRNRGLPARQSLRRELA